jgi:hypothetical protein
MPYTVARRGEGWVVCAEGRPVLIVRNRRVALHLSRKASELLVGAAAAVEAERDPAASAPTTDEENDP